MAMMTRAAAHHNLGEDYVVELGREQAHEGYDKRHGREEDEIARGQAAQYVADKLAEAELLEREGHAEGDGVLLKELFVGACHPHSPAALALEEAVSAEGAGHEGDYAAVGAAHAEHGADGVPVPAGAELHRAAHYPVRAQEVFKLLVRGLELGRERAGVHAVKAQYLLYRVARGAALVAEGRGGLWAEDGAGDVGKGLGKGLVVAQLAASYLFVKPAHALTPYSLVTSSA